MVQVKSVPFTAVTEVLPGQRTSILKRYGQPHEVITTSNAVWTLGGWWHTGGGNQPQAPCTEYTAIQLAPLILPLLSHQPKLVHTTDNREGALGLACESPAGIEKDHSR